MRKRKGYAASQRGTCVDWFHTRARAHIDMHMNTLNTRRSRTRVRTAHRHNVPRRAWMSAHKHCERIKAQSAPSRCQSIASHRSKEKGEHHRGGDRCACIMRYWHAAAQRIGLDWRRRQLSVGQTAFGTYARIGHCNIRIRFRIRTLIIATTYVYKFGSIFSRQ